ncbi:MAG TPA: hypothetical protein PKK43_08380 [Spirochaetota bacterium]|mgnify:CR=1 FL=1|nr:hypothetical protein [Spirochaetota bacterium]
MKKTHLTSLIRKFAVIILLIAALAAVRGNAYAKTTVTVDTTAIPLPVSIPLDGITSLIDDFQNKADTNGPIYADAFAFGNTLGYAIGRPTIGSFPHFEAGFTMNAGLTNMKYFKDDANKDSGKIPGVGIAPAFHFGVGLGAGLDFVGKFLTYSLDLYNPSKHLPDKYQLTKFTVYNLGGRLRYNVITEKPVIPFLLSFGGVTLSFGGDMSRGFIAMHGDYPDVRVDQPVSIEAPISMTVHPTIDGDYETNVSWYQVSGSVQATAYVKLISLFSLYTGVGMSVGYGWFKCGFDATGDLNAADTDTAYITYAGSSRIGTITAKSKNTYHPKNFLPTYILGLEFDIPLVKIVAESQVNLRNREDVSASLGIRIQI